jgi:hypothetical protein
MLMKRFAPEDCVTLERRFSTVKAIVLDEASMVSTALLAQIDSRLKEVRNVGEPFGGFVMVLVGDFFQLPPVGGSPLFTQVMRGDRAQRSIWDFQLLELSVQHRVNATEENTEHIRCIQAMRDPATCEEALRSVLFSKAKRLGHDGVQWPLNAPLVVASNAERASANRHFAVLAAIKENCPVLCFSLVKGGDPKNDEERFYFVANAPATITANLNVKRGVANGTRCSLVSLSYSEDDARAVAEKLVGAQAGQIILVPRPSWVVVCLKREGNRVEEVAIRQERPKGLAAAGRKVVPFQVEVAYACTFHKVQGMSLDAVVLDLNTRPPQLGKVGFESLYVALTRVTSAAGLVLMPERGTGFTNLVTRAPQKELLDWLRRRREPEHGPLPPLPPPGEAPRRVRGRRPRENDDQLPPARGRSNQPQQPPLAARQKRRRD